MAEPNTITPIVLAAGLGGGLDVVNASLLYFALKNAGHDVGLGSARPASQAAIRDHQAFATSGTIVTEASKIDKPLTSRYAEPLVAKYLNEQIVFLSRTAKKDAKEVYDPVAVRKAVEALFTKLHYTHVFFIDGGGDSLILRTGDGPSNTSPFEGGDAQMLRALHGIPNLYQGIISVGLDIHESKFFENITLLKERGGYYGRVNLRTGEQEDYTLGHLAPLNSPQDWLPKFLSFSERLLVLREADVTDPSKMMSHTAVVTYYALKGDFGVHRTFVPWEPVQPDGTKGVLVRPEHCWMYFVSPTHLENLKRELNPSVNTAAL